MIYYLLAVYLLSSVLSAWGFYIFQKNLYNTQSGYEFTLEDLLMGLLSVVIPLFGVFVWIHIAGNVTLFKKEK